MQGFNPTGPLTSRVHIFKKDLLSEEEQKKDTIIEAPNNDTKIDIEKENFKAMSLIISIEI